MLPDHRVSRSSTDQKISLPKRQLERLQQERSQAEAMPFWAEPMPLPPEVDFVGQTLDDHKSIALLAAVKAIAAERGVTTQEQLDIWSGADA